MKGSFYARQGFDPKDGWSVWKRTRTGHRRVGNHMSEVYARKIARLLNTDEAFPPLTSLPWKIDNG